jgi:hypothetical protein
MTLSSCKRESVEMNSSDMPSEKYSLAGSPVELTSASTAMLFSMIAKAGRRKKKKTPPTIAPSTSSPNGKDVSQIAIVRFRPKMRIIAGIDQLRVDAHAASGALDASFHHVCHPELLSDFAQVALNTGLVLHHTCAADNFEIGHAGKVAEHFVLHTVDKKCICFVLH